MIFKWHVATIDSDESTFKYKTNSLGGDIEQKQKSQKPIEIAKLRGLIFLCMKIRKTGLNGIHYDCFIEEK